MRAQLAVLILTGAKAIQAETLDEAILKDNLPDSSPMCIPSGQTTTDTVFESSFDDSKWAPKIEEYEEYVFLSKMTHTDDNENRTWTVRFGQGGNMYSYVGPMGETVPNNYRADYPWMKDVWQATSKMTSDWQFGISDSGSMLADTSETGGINLRDIPFYSPNLAKYCHEEDGECAFASWGQQSKVPTGYESGIVYMSRYKDCGNGVLEYTTLRHNTFGSPYTINFVYAPWGAVRKSNLQDLVMTNSGGGESEEQLDPYPRWPNYEPYYDREVAKRDISKTLGYSVFAQDLISKTYKDGDLYPLPVNDDNGQQYSITITEGGCRLNSDAPNWYQGQYNCEIERMWVIPSGTSDSVRLTSSRGGEVIAPMGIQNWAWNGNRLIFISDHPSASDTVEKFQDGDTITVTYAELGRRAEDNLAMAHVHGTGNGRYTEIQASVNERIDSYEYKTQTFPSIPGGSTHFYRQYFIMDQYTNMATRGPEWSEETLQNVYGMAGGPAGRHVSIWASDQSFTFGATIGVGGPFACDGDHICTGSTTPSGTKKPLYEIKCGNNDVAVTSDPYYYAPDGETKQPYVCTENDAVRPTWKLLGFFDEGACEDISEGYSYEEDFCDASSGRTGRTTKVCTANVWGDPHLVTFDGLKYDAQPKGEAIFLMQTTSSLQINGRLEQAKPEWQLPAVTTGIAIKGKTDDQPKIQLSLTTAESKTDTLYTHGGHPCHVALYIDDVKQQTIFHDSGNDGASVQKNGKKVTVHYPGLLNVEISVHFFGRCHFWMDASLLDCDADGDTVIGLLGSPNGDTEDDWMQQDGTVKEIPEGASAHFFKPAFDYVKANWIITDADDSIFSNEEGESFESFSVDDEPYDPEFEEMINNADADIVAICGDDIACRVDGEVLGTDAAVEYKTNPATARTITLNGIEDMDLCLEEL